MTCCAALTRHLNPAVIKLPIEFGFVSCRVRPAFSPSQKYMDKTSTKCGLQGNIGSVSILPNLASTQKYTYTLPQPKNIRLKPPLSAGVQGDIGSVLYLCIRQCGHSRMLLLIRKSIHHSRFRGD
ncbi:hypothetical protein M413DRAFT_445836 [Hebeloma cylindrosporum]|uniref:Uncharacterized protein n=1 Tax=Hebeloma cylindrosporum TaxID=76867 RepID=A0A0C3CA84_HEBCY|nr:hypothetical protein M413DRAFT_445836 [Hebeloma cylindrosporum h7]